MYKHASANLQRRRTRIVEARPSAAVYITPDDLLDDCGAMTMAACLAERDLVLRQKAQAESELQSAKRRGCFREREGLGTTISAHCTRLAQLNQRIGELNRQRTSDQLRAFKTAARALLPDDQFMAIVARAEAGESADD